MAQIVVFVFSVTLTLTFDLFSIVCHTHCAWCTGISMRSFIRICPVILGDMPWTHTHKYGKLQWQSVIIYLVSILPQTRGKMDTPAHGWNWDKIINKLRHERANATLFTEEHVCPYKWSTLLILMQFVYYLYRKMCLMCPSYPGRLYMNMLFDRTIQWII